MHFSSSSNLASGVLLVLVLLLVLWLWERRATEGPARVRAAVLCAAVALSAFVAGWAFSILIEFGRNELRSGEVFSLMPDVLAVVVASGIQCLCASFLLASAVDGTSVRRYGALLAAVLVFAGAGVISGSMASSGVQHAVSAGDRPVPEAPSQVAGEVQELDVPEGNVLSVHTISSGVLWGLEDGAMAVDPLTGEELWRYRLLDGGARPEAPVSIEVVPGLETVVIESTRASDQDPSEYSTSRVTVDAASGEVLHRVEDSESVLGEGTPSRGTDSSPVEGEGVVVAGDGSGQLQVFGSSSGAHLWSSQGAADCSGDPSNTEVVAGAEATDTHVFATLRCPSDEDGAEPLRSVVHAFAADTGELEWTHEIEDADHPTGGDFTVSSDGTLLYRYEQTVGTYAVIDTRTGDEVAAGEWEDPRPAGGVWENVTGDGVLLGEGPEVTLTDADGEPAHTVNLGTDELEGPFVATEEALHLLERPEGAGPVELHVHPWDGSEPYAVENVLGGELGPNESVDMRLGPGGIVVHTEVSGRVTSAFAVS